MKNATLFTTLAASTMLATTAFADMNPMVGGAEMFPTKNIVENAVNSADHTTLVAAVKAAGLVDTLASGGMYEATTPRSAMSAISSAMSATIRATLAAAGAAAGAAACAWGPCRRMRNCSTRTSR